MYSPPPCFIAPLHLDGLAFAWGGALLHVYAVPSELVGADEADPLVAEADSRNAIDEYAIAKARDS
jgi:hypothetical protein